MAQRGRPKGDPTLLPNEPNPKYKIPFEVMYPMPSSVKRMLPRHERLTTWVWHRTNFKTGAQTWDCQYLHVYAPGPQTVSVEVRLMIVPRQSEWNQYKFKLKIPKGVPDKEAQRINTSVREWLDNIIYFYVAPYF